MDEKQVVNLLARITVAELLIESLYAQSWAKHTEDEAERAGDGIMALISGQNLSAHPDSEFLQEVQNESIVVAEGLLDSILSRAQELRD